MEKDLYKELEEMKELKRNVEVVEQIVRRKRREFEESLRDTKIYIKNNNEVLTAMKESTISVRVGDLLEELSKNSGIDIHDIECIMSTIIPADDLETITEEELEMFEKYGDLFILNVLIYGEEEYKKESIEYKFSIPVNLLAIQADGESLFDRSSVIPDYYEGESSFIIEADYNKEDVILNIPLETLADIGKDKEQHELFIKSLNNCINKEKPVVKKKQ